MADKLTLDRHAMRDRSTAHLRIYVGNLTEKASVDDLYDHFSPYGPVNGIVINKGFGFVQFQDEESAQKAITHAQGTHFQGKALNVRSAVQNAERPRWEPAEGPPSEIPHAVTLSDELAQDDGNEPYDNFGNYIGGDRDDDGGYDGDSYEAFPPLRGRGRGGGGPRGRGGRGARGPRGGERGAPPPHAAHRERDLLPEREFMGRGPPAYERFPAPPPRALPAPDRNDCEIIVVSKTLTEYAEYIESRLKRLGIVVDLLYPMEDVPIGKVLGNIASRGCLYAILVMPQNQENRSLTLTILHGLPQEHRNMPVEDALSLLSRNFQEVRRGGPTGREAVWALLGQLADGKTLTVMQYDKVAEYIQEKREQQVKLELGETPATTAGNKTQAELQQRILSILNDSDKQPPAPAPAAKPALLNDPTVRKALDSILHKFV